MVKRAMDKAEASALLDQHLSEFARRPYSELAALIDHPQALEAKGASGTSYLVEFNVVSDAGVGGNLRIIGSIDDGGWRWFMPLTKTEIMKPSGELV